MFKTLSLTVCLFCIGGFTSSYAQEFNYPDVKTIIVGKYIPVMAIDALP